MKKNIFTILFLFIFASFSFSLDLDFYITPIFGVRKSETEEILYFSGTFGTDKNKKCSQLNWNEKKCYVLGNKN